MVVYVYCVLYMVYGVWYMGCVLSSNCMYLAITTHPTITITIPILYNHLQHTPTPTHTIDKSKRNIKPANLT